jgi:cytochrome c peroxidase
VTTRVPLGAIGLGLAAVAAAAALPATALVVRAEEPAFSEDEVRRLQRHSPVPRLPPDETNKVADDPAAARLGQALFFDARLSPGGRVSCASCHDPAKSWTDGRSLSVGAGRGSRNTLSLWNVGYNRWYFWDGRADSLWSQALKPMESPTEMGGSRLAVAWLVGTDARLRAAYAALFGAPPDALARRLPRSGGPSSADAAERAAWERLAAEDRAAVNQVFVDVGKAIAAFERRLVSRRAPFDVFVEGLREGDAAKQAALSEAARRGARLFVGRGKCAVCHAGPLFTDGEFHDIGVPPNEAVPLPDIGRLAGIQALLEDDLGAAGPWSDDRDGPRAGLVRYLAPRPEVAGQVKTPSLRNVALTAPYMHAGQLQTLRDVLHYYSTLEGRRGLPAQQERILVPLQLSEQETADLVAFLESLTDTALEPSLLRPPEAPAGRDVPPGGLRRGGPIMNEEWASKSRVPRAPNRPPGRSILGLDTGLNGAISYRTSPWRCRWFPSGSHRHESPRCCSWASPLSPPRRASRSR